MQTFDTSMDARTAGSLMVLQAFVGQLIAHHPKRDEILKKMDSFANGLTFDPANFPTLDDQDGETAADFIADMQQGVRDCLRSIDHATALASRPSGGR